MDPEGVGSASSGDLTKALWEAGMNSGATIRAVAALVALTLLLGGCGDSVDPALSATVRADSPVGRALSQARNVLAAAVAGTGAATLASFPGLPPAPAGALPRGRYDWDATAAAWTRTSDSQDLALTWPSGGTHGHMATLTIDWAAGGSTLQVGGAQGAKRSVPSDASASLAVDGQERGAVRVELGWHATPCGIVAQPDQVRAGGGLAAAGTALRLREATLAVTGSDSAVTITTTGALATASGGARASLSWTVTLHGSVFRDPATCLPTGLTVGGGLVKLTLASAGHDVELSTAFSNVARNNAGQLQSASLSGGHVSIDGAQAFSFHGTLDDANHDGVPGEHVTLVTEGGGHMAGDRFLARNARGLLEAVGALATLGR
ncbi:MAG TPA: hypothetical protein VKA00_05525 [Trueperaceae bacterium]|nr:hypothetical protein [Trueperaceae bacterium]